MIFLFKKSLLAIDFTGVDGVFWYDFIVTAGGHNEYFIVTAGGNNKTSFIVTAGGNNKINFLSLLGTKKPSRKVKPPNSVLNRFNMTCQR